MSIQDIAKDHSDSIDSILSEFTNKLHAIIQAASDSLFNELKGKLKTTSGKIDPTLLNQKTIASIDARFMQLMDINGYSDLLDEYTSSFNGQFEWFNKILESINEELIWPLDKPSFSKADMAELKGLLLHASVRAYMGCFYFECRAARDTGEGAYPGPVV